MSTLPDSTLVGKRVTVMGLGRFGGGVGVTRWLAERGARVLVTDLASESALTGPIESISDLIESGSVGVRLGGHEARDFADADLVVANPAIPKPWKNPHLSTARLAGVPITTEIGLLVARLPGRDRLIAITGTAGKSTTAALCAHILDACGQPVALGGNIGGSLLARLDDLSPEAWVVVELSSAMLYWLEDPSARVAAVTSFAPNHLDWHETSEHYRVCKQRLLDALPAGSDGVLGPSARDWPVPEGARRHVVEPPARDPGLRIPGAHNALNAALAARICTRLGIPGLDEADAREAARTFPGLAHRLRTIAVLGGVRAIDDSKSTTPEATRLALDALAESPGLDRVHLIAGGSDKGADLSPLAGAAPDLAGLYTIGQTGPALARAAGGYAQDCETLEAAVAAAWRRARAGDTLLLSPGCASWDQFDNYEARGEAFARAVRAQADDGQADPPGPLG